MTSLHNVAGVGIAWDSMTYAEKNHQLYLKQLDLLDQFLKPGAITQKQHDKSLHDLTENRICIQLKPISGFYQMGRKGRKVK